MERVFWALRDLVFSSRCLVCGAYESGHDICSPCRSAWHGQPQRASYSPEVYAMRPYDRMAQRVILAVKERGHHVLEPVLAEAIAFSCLPFVTNAPLVIVPIPSRSRATRQRGADVLWNIARQVAGLLNEAGVRAQAIHMLTHARTVADQTGLSAVERGRNLHGAMRLIHAKNGIPRSLGRFIVVDDLFTTGASVREAIRVLAEIGDVAGGACAASTALGSVADSFAR